MKIFWFIVFLECGALTVSAHVGTQDSTALQLSWSLEPGVVLTLAAPAITYALGIAEFRAAGRRCFSRWRTASFFAGWLALVIALISPIDGMGARLFSAHMVQHEILMLVAAPLIILGKPLPVLLKAMPRILRRAVLRTGRPAPVRIFTRFLTAPLSAWLIHAILLWLWHLPALFDSAARSNPIHALQHLCFFGSALLFWWAALDGQGREKGSGAAVLYVFGTALHNGLLGAMLTFSNSPWYATYSARNIGLGALQDQQFGGLIMWIPACSIYILGGLWLFARWLHSAEARAAQSPFQPHQELA